MSHDKEPTEPVFTPVQEEVHLDERDQLALGAVDTLREEREQSEASESQQDEPEQEAPMPFDDEDARMMLSCGLAFIEMTVGSFFDVPFEIETKAGDKWLDAASPMLKKYGPDGLKWFGQYQGEISFAMASMTLIGGCTVQVRRLKQEKEVLTESAQEVEDEVAKSNEQEQCA